MKLGKFTKGTIALVEVEDGMEIGGQRRSEAKLYELGYKKACLTPRPSEDAEEEWEDCGTCLVQNWREPVEEVEQNAN